MSFEIGQIFESADGIFPEGAAEWCNNNRAFIQEIDRADYYVDVSVPNDDGSPSVETKKELIKNGRRFQINAIPEPTQEEINAQTQTRLTAAVQNVLDTEAQKLGYDNCLSVCSYIDTGVSKFDDEGKAFRSWRSAVWAKGYEILDEVVSGKREIPTEEELLAELPTLEIVYRKEQ